jgi:transposase
MLTHEQYIRIRYLYMVDHLTSVQIGGILNISERTVRNWWKVTEYSQKRHIKRKKTVVEFEDWIKRMLSEHPYLSGTQIYQKLQKFGYAGSSSAIRRYLASVRTKPKRSFLTLAFEPGEAMQVDFGYCGYLRHGEKSIRLCICAAVLCHSRLLYAEIIPSEKLEHTFSCLQNALMFFGGAPRKIIVDNFKGAVLHHGRHGDIRYNPRFLDFTSHYGMLPVACTPHSPQEKGRIENGIGYIKGNFITGSNFSSLEEAQMSFKGWLEKTANVRIHGTTRQQPIVSFNSEEKNALLPLNPHRFDCARIENRLADSRCRVWCDGNQYSVPSRYAGINLSLKITSENVYIYHDGKLITSHLRSYAKGHTIADPSHCKLMLEERQTAAKQNLKSDFLALGQDAATMLRELEARMLNIESHMKKIMLLVEIYGKIMVQNALMSAVENQVYGADYVEYLIRLKKRPVENSMGLLHVTKGADNLNVTLGQADLDEYDIK